MHVRDLIIQKIQESGPITFRDYMDMALYQPSVGYYTSPEHRIGKRGDFFTSPYISSAFGAMIARQIEEIWQQSPKKFTIVEYGAGAGFLCHDILQYLEMNAECYSSIQYVIIEKSTVLRKLSQSYLHNKVIWVEEIKEIGEFEGCVISNELFDNFPVHRVFLENGQLMEILVDYSGDFKEIYSASNSSIADYARFYPLDLPEGFCTEICRDVEKWYQDLTKYMRSGYIITIDYGYLSEMSPSYRQKKGSIRSYRNHQKTDNLYAYPGDQDITADVNFSVLIYQGRKNGFTCNGFVNQRNFLRALGFVPYLHDMKDSEEDKKYTYTILLDQMGNSFKVLIQQKNVLSLPLRGLSLSHPVDQKICAWVAA